MLLCQNVTMSQFADRLLNGAPGLNWPILDATELEGSYDLTLIYSRNQQMLMNGPARGGDGEPGASPVLAASDPSGGFTIFEALEKQLGLKLEARKRQLPVIVIDHLEPKPTEN